MQLYVCIYTLNYMHGCVYIYIKQFVKSLIKPYACMFKNRCCECVSLNTQCVYVCVLQKQRTKRSGKILYKTDKNIVTVEKIISLKLSQKK